LQHFFAVVWFAAKIYRMILMYGKTNMERAVQMVAILVNKIWGANGLIFVSLQSYLLFAFISHSNSRGARGYRLYQG
jgi:hypothetical protein